MSANKITFGLKNVHYSIAEETSDGSWQFETPERLPGAQEFTSDALGGTTPVYADDQIITTLVANGGRTLSLKVTELPDHFKTSILGYKVLENGNYVEVANVKPVTFALGCEIQGDVKARRIWFYLCNVAPISESSKTKADSIEANGITLNITVRPLQISNDYAITNISARPGDSNYASFFSRAPEIPSL